MDWLLERQPRIEQALARRHLSAGMPVLYDVTSSYCEGRTCPLLRFGHNRDGKCSKTQVLYGVRRCTASTACSPSSPPAAATKLLI